MAQPAFASSGTYNDPGGAIYDPQGCNKVYYNPNGNGTNAYTSMSDYVTYSNSLVIENSSYTYGDAGIVCGLSGGGYEATAYKIVLTNSWTLTGTKLAACSAGIPSGFTCTNTTTSVTYSYTNTCSNVSRCTHNFGYTKYYPGSGSFSSYLHTLTVTYSNKSGNAYTLHEYSRYLTF